MGSGRTPLRVLFSTLCRISRVRRKLEVEPIDTKTRGIPRGRKRPPNSGVQIELLTHWELCSGKSSQCSTSGQSTSSLHHLKRETVRALLGHSSAFKVSKHGQILMGDPLINHHQFAYCFRISHINSLSFMAIYSFSHIHQ